jgi:cyclopropane fatty-acyl-phospholipid synthase-like methyltransferase
MIDAQRCRLCSHDGVEAVLTLSGMPRWNHRLIRAQELAADRGIDVTAYRCLSCGFVSLPMRLSGDYYDDYVNVPSLSSQAQQFQAEQAREFVARFCLTGCRILEVGCGDGFFLRAMQDAGAQGFGIEPSSAQCQLARARGLQIEQGILAGGRRLADAPFDAFVTRQVFEHVEDIRDFLLTIRGNLQVGAVGLVEVPNLEKLLDEARFFDFIPEHINYFTPRTLSLALDLAGFEVVEVCPVQDGESLRALVRWQAPPDYGRIGSRAGSLRTDMATFMSACRSQGKKVAIWGAGGKGLSMMASVDVSDVQLLVDADPSKVGLYAPVSHLQVSPPQALASQAVDAVIVMAPAYEREIVRKLRTEWAFAGKIVLAGRGFEIVD